MRPSLLRPLLTEPSIEEAWAATQRSLPRGWTLDGLRCASSGLDAEQRSEDWIAVAIGPSGEERTHRAADALSALDGLAVAVQNAA